MTLSPAFLLTVAGLLALSGSASAQSVLWTRLSRSTPPCRPGAMAIDAAKNVYVAGALGGRSKGGNPLARGMCLIKYDASGQQLWTRLYDATEAAFPSGLTVDPSNGVYVAGSFYGTFLGQKSAGGGDVFLLKLDGDGEKVWMRSAGSRGEDSAEAGLVMGRSGSLYVAGYSTGVTGGERSDRDFDIVLRKYSPAGDQLWSRTHNAAMEELAFGVAVDAAENVYLAGSTRAIGSTSSRDLSILKFGKAGNKRWVATFGTEEEDQAARVAVDSHGEVYVAGYTAGELDGIKPSGPHMNVVISKLDAKGTKLWTRFVIYHLIINRLAFDAADNLYLFGRTEGDDFFLARYGRDGVNRWTRTWGTPGSDVPGAMALDQDGFVYLAGQTESRKNAGQFDVCLIKFGPQAPSFDCSKAVSVQEVLICGNARLSALDSTIAQLYADRLRSSPAPAEVKAEQLRWLKEERNACKNADQLAACLQQRVEALKATPPSHQPSGE